MVPLRKKVLKYGTPKPGLQREGRGGCGSGFIWGWRNEFLGFELVSHKLVHARCLPSPMHSVGLGPLGFIGFRVG